MNREYQTSPTMLADRFNQRVVEPDAGLVRQLHLILDTLPDNTALSIDHIVALLIKFHNPNRQHYEEILPPGAKS